MQEQVFETQSGWCRTRFNGWGKCIYKLAQRFKELVQLLHDTYCMSASWGIRCYVLCRSGHHVVYQSLLWDCGQLAFLSVLSFSSSSVRSLGPDDGRPRLLCQLSSTIFRAFEMAIFKLWPKHASHRSGNSSKALMMSVASSVVMQTMSFLFIPHSSSIFSKKLSDVPSRVIFWEELCFQAVWF